MVEVCLELDFIFNYTNFYLFNMTEPKRSRSEVRKLSNQCDKDSGRTLVQLPPTCDINDASEQQRGYINSIYQEIEKISTFYYQRRLNQNHHVSTDIHTKTCCHKCSCLRARNSRMRGFHLHPSTFIKGMKLFFKKKKKKDCS